MNAKLNKLVVQDIEISLTTIDKEDYICLTDMADFKDGDSKPDVVIQNWLRNRDTIEYLGLWETLYNKNFKPLEFEGFRQNAGLNRFTLSPKQWIEKTNAIGIKSKQGRGGGTYAHKDIAFEFGAWLSPTFKLYLIKEYQRLKQIETNQYGLEWNVHRILSKVNYRIQTDAIKYHKIPEGHYTFDTERFAYTEEADLLNIIMFNSTAKQWKDANPERAAKGENIRDSASINELTILSNLESHNANLIRKGIGKEQRFVILQKEAETMRKSLASTDFMKSLKKYTDGVYIDAEKDSPEQKKEIPKRKRLFGK